MSGDESQRSQRDARSDDGAAAAAVSERPPSPDPHYLERHFRRHVLETQAHERGDIDGHVDALEYSLFEPAAHWTPAEKARFFHALARHSRLRPDLIAAHVRTKNAVDVGIYIELLRSAAAGCAELLPRAKFPQAHEAPPALVAYEDAQGPSIARCEPAYARHAALASRHAEQVRFQAGLRAPRGAAKGKDRDRAQQKERRAVYTAWLEGRQRDWGREDALAALDSVELAVFDRILREDEEKRYSAPSAPVPPGAEPPPPPSPSPATATVDDALIDPILLAESARQRRTSGSPRPGTAEPRGAQTPSGPGPAASDADIVPADLSPASRRRLYKRMYMRRKRAEKAGTVVSTTAARLKPGRKPKGEPAAAESGRSTPLEVQSEGAGPSSVRTASDSEDGTRKRPNKGGLTRPYKFRRTLDVLGVDAAFLRAQGLGLFNHAALGRLLRLHAEVDGGGGAPDEGPSAIAVDTVRYLDCLVRFFVRRAVGMAVRVRETDFALKAHTKVWRLGKHPHVLAKHVQGALEMMGYPRLSKHDHFGAMATRIPGLDPVELEDGPPPPRRIVFRPRKKRKKKQKTATPPAGDDADDEDDAPRRESYRWPDRHMAQPFVYFPDGVSECYPFGVDARGTRPVVSVMEGRRRAEDERRAMLDLMPEETDEEALEREIEEEEALEVADARQAEKAIGGVMADLGLEEGEKEPRKKQRRRWQTTPVDEKRAEESDSQESEEVPLRKRRRTVRIQKGNAPEEAPQEDTESADTRPAKKRKVATTTSLARRPPDGVHIKSAAYVEDSDSDMDES
ncbi:hypothetical protein K488DRAFT_72978 [Vararia minispora EC-137]|uniref:Uncharacterized protein n=1 Tax=Vararia minispora EC-137 TaxID=1314806 RepID=A0ACB8QCN5_9AGAM|nr:hypothetical protein K488DRAFT_72978 [Vararia minispora EC-137]